MGIDAVLGFLLSLPDQPITIVTFVTGSVSNDSSTHINSYDPHSFVMISIDDDSPFPLTCSL
jgi:hypothetical protein